MKEENKSCCDFCKEINKDCETLFNNLYKGIFSTRIIWSSDTFVVLPTIGQFLDYSLLVLPKKHYESLSDLSIKELNDLVICYNHFYDLLSKEGSVLAFEHGAHSNTGGSCGIYHAHLHIIPSPINIDLFSFFKHEFKVFDSLSNAFLKLGNAQEYLLAINANKKVGILDSTNLKGYYQSQYFRRMLCEYLNIPLPWDWREYKTIEERLIHIVKHHLVPA